MGRFKGDLPQRSFEFAHAILQIVDRIPDGTIGWVVAKQLTRSGTSVGANVAEANGALTNAEFASICNIARREAAETTYWLKLCETAGLVDAVHLDHAITEAVELHDILATIVRKTQTQ